MLFGDSNQSPCELLLFLPVKLLYIRLFLFTIFEVAIWEHQPAPIADTGAMVISILFFVPFGKHNSGRKDK